jgi:hypothetical protein
VEQSAQADRGMLRAGCGVIVEQSLTIFNRNNYFTFVVLAWGGGGGGGGWRGGWGGVEGGMGGGLV